VGLRLLDTRWRSVEDGGEALSLVDKALEGFPTPLTTMHRS